MGLVKSFQVFGIGSLRFSNSTLLTQIADSHASIPVQVGTGFWLTNSGFKFWMPSGLKGSSMSFFSMTSKLVKATPKTTSACGFFCSAKKFSGDYTC